MRIYENIREYTRIYENIREYMRIYREYITLSYNRLSNKNSIYAIASNKFILYKRGFLNNT